MAKKKRVRNFFKSFFNFRVWIGEKHIRSGASFISTTFSNLKNSVPSTELKRESFEQAVRDQGLTEAQVQQAKHNYLRNAIILLLVGLVFAMNSIYLIYAHKFSASIVSFMVTMMVFIFSLKFHFWFFQIKNRKLGCSLTEWYNNKVT